MSCSFSRADSETSRLGGTVSAIYQKRMYCVFLVTGANWVQTGSVTKDVDAVDGEGLLAFGWRVGIGKGSKRLR